MMEDTMALVTLPRVQEMIERDPQFKQTDLDILRDWLKQQPHLPPISDYELMLFLHGKNYRLERAKATIDAFVTFRTYVPEFFARRDPLGCDELKKSLKTICSIPLPSTTPEGYGVIYSKFLDLEPSHCILADCIKVLFMVVELWVRIESFSPGHIVLVNMDGVKFGHLSCLNPMVMKKLAYFMRKVNPLRMKGIHFMNPVPFMDTFINMIGPFVGREFVDLHIHVHTSMDSLNKMIPIDILPNEVGGKAGPCQDLWSATIKKLEEYREWFLYDETRKVNEAARPAKAKYPTEIFGVEGSFRKLDID